MNLSQTIKSVLMLALISVLIFQPLSMTATASEADDDSLLKDLLDTISNNEEAAREIMNGTPATKPEVLNELREKTNVIAVYGSIPKTEKGRESYEWFLAVSSTVRRLANDEALNEYYYRNGGPIIGIRYGDFISILIDEQYPGNITEKDLECFRNLVKKHSSNQSFEFPLAVIKEPIPVIEV